MRIRAFHLGCSPARRRGREREAVIVPVPQSIEFASSGVALARTARWSSSLARRSAPLIKLAGQSNKSKQSIGRIGLRKA
jgi:hypothetical protein